jgi:hypothetical protein
MRVMTIQIDVHLVEESSTTHHTLSALDPCMTLDHTYSTRSTYSNVSRSHQQS